MDNIKRKDKYIKEIIEVAKDKENINQIVVLENLLLEYYKFCSESNLNPRDAKGMENIVKNCFILESVPLVFEVDDEKVEEAILHLKEVLKDKNDGITKEEAYILLNKVVQNARMNLINDLYSEKALDEFLNSSLQGCCGLSQALTLFPFMLLGLKVTMNNASYFPYCKKVRHAFGTVTIPIKENEVVEEVPFLIDISYRQFFMTLYSNEGRYYLKYGCDPEAGFYICKTKEGKEFAYELLKMGYIPWNKKNAKLYGSAFSCSSLNLETRNKEEEILNTREEVYYENVFAKENQEANSYDLLDLERAGYVISLDAGLKR